jgi:lipoprotein-anchoring transpeptidase ErfK/SrfK
MGRGCGSPPHIDRRALHRVIARQGVRLESVTLSQQAAGAPYALALSARSNALREFDGGPGQIALHGTGNIGGIPGSAVSHGCIRLETPAITWLATRITPGTPVTITQ